MKHIASVALWPLYALGWLAAVVVGTALLIGSTVALGWSDARAKAADESA